MSSPGLPLADDEARRRALTSLQQSLLVEAGAGSGKTSILAGRVLMLLASGVKPMNIAAITFTELAASELFDRIYCLVEEGVGGIIREELRVAFPSGLSESQIANLKMAQDEFDELTISTIHGFCQHCLLYTSDAADE